MTNPYLFLSKLSRYNRKIYPIIKFVSLHKNLVVVLILNLEIQIQIHSVWTVLFVGLGLLFVNFAIDLFYFIIIFFNICKPRRCISVWSVWWIGHNWTRELEAGTNGGSGAGKEEDMRGNNGMSR